MFFGKRSNYAASALSSKFSALDMDEDAANKSEDQAPGAVFDWKPTFFNAWPFKDGDDLPKQPWLRPEQEPMSFVGANVVDVENSKVLNNMTVRIKKGEIVSITKSKDVDMQEHGYTSIDCSGLYMTPGLIDCHQHLIGVGDLDTDNEDYAVAFNCRGFLNNGFTTIRDVGGARRRHREATENWIVPGPRLFVGGPVLSQTGGHGDQGDRDARPVFYGGIEPMSSSNLAQVVDGVDACLKVARKIMSQGADHIKICSSGGVLSQYDKLDSSQFTVPEIKAICDTVRMMGGTLVTSHCNTDQGARNAIEGGIGGIEHGGLLEKSTVELMAKKGIHFTPTFTIQEYIVNGPMGKTISKFSLAKAKMVAERSYQSLKMAHEAGVNIAYGTDCPVQIVNAEFIHRAKVLPSKEILKHATCNAAKVVGQVGKIGCIKEGAYADLLLLGANPLEDVTILARPDKYIKAVVKDGRCVRSSVDGLRVEVSLN